VAYAQLQRIDANAKSPLLIHLQESAAGASLLRAYSLMDEWTAQSDRLVDDTTRAFNAFNSAGRWFAVRVEAMGALILICVGFLAWYYDQLSASLVGASTVSRLLLLGPSRLQRGALSLSPPLSAAHAAST
jgi:hypothetical protein